jgi:hypothetical protein
MRKLLTLTFAIASALITGCGSDGATTAPSQSSIAGTWNLATINGSPLPFVVQASNPKLEVLSDQLVVNANGTFTENGQLRVSQGGTVVNQAVVGAGTYTLDGTAVSFQWSDGSTGTATVSGRTATVAEDGYSYVYKQQ